MKLKLTRSITPHVKVSTEDLATLMAIIEIQTDSFDNYAPATEGWGVDLFYDRIIGWFLHRGDETLSHLKQAVPECIERVKEASDGDFKAWRTLRQISVFSKYLPDYADMAGAHKSLIAASKYILSINDPAKFDIDQFRACFRNSCYIKRGKYSDDEVTGLGFFNLFGEDVRQRGWVGRNTWLDGLNKCKELLVYMEKISLHVKSMNEKTFEQASSSQLKDYSQCVKETVRLIGYLGRGVTSAAWKISGSLVARIFATEN